MSELIRREDAIREMFRFKGYIGFDEDMLYRIRYAINQIPTIDVMPVVHGEWIVSYSDGDRFPHMNCSHCGMFWREIAHKNIFDFCPKCGARMDGERREATPCP